MAYDNTTECTISDLLYEKVLILQLIFGAILRITAHETNIEQNYQQCFKNNILSILKQICNLSFKMAGKGTKEFTTELYTTFSQH